LAYEILLTYHAHGEQTQSYFLDASGRACLLIRCPIDTCRDAQFVACNIAL